MTYLQYETNIDDISGNIQQSMVIKAPTKQQVGTTSFNMTVIDGNGARTESMDIVCKVVASPLLIIRNKNIKITQKHTQRIGITMLGYNIQTIEVTSSHPKVIPDNMVRLQKNDDESYEIHITGNEQGTTTLSFVAVDGNQARSLPTIIQATVLPPPTIEIVDQRNIVIVLNSKTTGVVRGLKYVEAIITGAGPINIVTLSSNLDVINPSLGHLIVSDTTNGKKFTVKTSQDRVGSAVVRCVVTDVNGASASVDFQVDIIKEKGKSKHQLWQERNRNP